MKELHPLFSSWTTVCVTGIPCSVYSFCSCTSLNSKRKSHGILKHIWNTSKTFGCLCSSLVPVHGQWKMNSQNPNSPKKWNSPLVTTSVQYSKSLLIIFYLRQWPSNPLRHFREISSVHSDPMTSTGVPGPSVIDVSVSRERNAGTGIMFSLKIFNLE